MKVLEPQLRKLSDWMEDSRFNGIHRLHSAADVLAQRGTIQIDYTVARNAAEKFYPRLRELFAERAQITTFGPYSPGQAVAMKRMGIEAIYLGGWATSAKGSLSEDPGPDLASYPLSQVPDEAAALVRALLAADKNQHFARVHMAEDERRAAPPVDFQPFIIADADTGHGGDAHVRNLIRRFVEVGVPGYHIEDQKPGAKKCGHQAGKVLVGCDEQIKRLNAARLQLDIMGVPGIIVARTDAESATLLENRSDERDQPFILGATNVEIPSYKTGYAALLQAVADDGVEDVRGHLLFAISSMEHRAALEWFEQVGFLTLVRETSSRLKKTGGKAREQLDALQAAYSDLWQSHARMKTYGDAVADQMALLAGEGQQLELSVEEWNHLAAGASLYDARARAKQMGVDVVWDCELPKTPDGYYHVQGGIPYAIAKSLAVAPFADLIWMETKTADLHDAREFAAAIHAIFPEKMLAYNLSPSFNWDTTGMTDEEMTRFPQELGKLGFVFNFITYGGHQIDGLAAEEFAASLRQEGMLALARLQRKFRLLDSPYKTPQTLVGGGRLDAALMASSGGTAATKAMSKGSTQYQHLVQTEVSPTLLTEWLDSWRRHHGQSTPLRVELRPHTPGSDLLQLKIIGGGTETLLNVVFTTIQDRRGRTILTIRDQNTIPSLRKKRLMTLAQLFLIHRYRAAVVHYVTPTDDNEAQTAGMRVLGIFSSVSTEVGQIIVAHVSQSEIIELVKPGSEALHSLIHEKK